MALPLRRLVKDLAQARELTSEGIFVDYDEENLTKLHAIIIGPDDTPYEAGIFRFQVTILPNYPHCSPRVKFLTTDNGRVRFNPNLYADGTVCLSILGTWEGPGWTAAMSISSVLLSIRSLLCEEPYYNEPGYKAGTRQKQSDAYNKNIEKETFHVAILKELKTLLLDEPNVTLFTGNLGYNEAAARFVLSSVKTKELFIKKIAESKARPLTSSEVSLVAAPFPEINSEKQPLSEVPLPEIPVAESHLPEISLSKEPVSEVSLPGSPTAEVRLIEINLKKGTPTVITSPGISLAKYPFSQAPLTPKPQAIFPTSTLSAHDFTKVPAASQMEQSKKAEKQLDKLFKVLDVRLRTMAESEKESDNDIY